MRWDLLQEHLDRAEDAFSKLERAHDRTTYAPALLEQRVERQLFANLDALVVAGGGLRDFLRSALMEDEDASISRRICAGMALIGLGRQEELIALLPSADPDVCQASLQALVHLGDAKFDTWLRDELERRNSDTPRKILMQGALERNVEVGNLLVPLQSSDDEEVALAAALAQHADSGLHRPLIDYLTEHPARAVRNAAILTGVVFGSGRAFRACIAAAEDQDTPNGFAMLLAALADGAAARAILSEHLTRPGHADVAAFALGVCGQLEAAETLVHYLDHGRRSTARLAGEAFATITGLDLREGSFERSQLDEEEDEDEEPDPILMPRGLGDLPLPNRDAVFEWWVQSGRRLPRESSCIDGGTWSSESALEYLRRAPLRRRHAVALWLTIHSGGALRVSTRRFMPFQRAQLARAATLPSRLRVRNFQRMA